MQFLAKTIRDKAPGAAQEQPFFFLISPFPPRVNFSWAELDLNLSFQASFSSGFRTSLSCREKSHWLGVLSWVESPPSPQWDDVSSPTGRACVLCCVGQERTRQPVGGLQIALAKAGGGLKGSRPATGRPNTTRLPSWPPAAVPRITPPSSSSTRGRRGSRPRVARRLDRRLRQGRFIRDRRPYFACKVCPPFEAVGWERGVNGWA